MIAKLKICLLDDWRCVLRRAWSIRFSLLAAAFTAAEVVVPLFGDVLLDVMPRGAFVLLAFAASIGATVARIVAHRRTRRVVLVQKDGPVMLLGQRDQRRLKILDFGLADLVVAVEEVDAPHPTFLVRDVVLQPVTNGVGFADVDRLFGGIADEDVDAGLREARLLLQQMEKLLVEDYAVARPVRLVEVANSLWVTGRGE